MSRQAQLENLQEPPQQLGHLKSLLAGGLPGVFTDEPHNNVVLFHNQAALVHAADKILFWVNPK